VKAERLEREAATTAIEGLALRTESGFCTVLTDDGRRVLVNQAKKIKFGGRTSTTPVVIGDRVRLRLEPEDEGGGVVDIVLERRNELCRRAPGRRAMKDVLAANLDTLVIVQALHRPDFNAAQLDRFLAIAEQASIPATVILNKHDLSPPGEAEAIAKAYRNAGYPVVISSAKIEEGIDEVHRHLRGISALIGPSGVGKSTILNRIRPDLHLRTREVSESTGKGRHTTVTSELLPLGLSSYVADTPGLRSVALTDLDRYEVASLFRELQPLIGQCRFADCLHTEEPGCAVKEALTQGRFARERYASYQRLLQDVTDGYLQDWETA
jgi:ribosome biogenesis GTPase / thiamine phosphate phosphatase